MPISRALGPEGRGTVAFITVTAIVAATLARFGVTDATTVFCAQRPPQRSVLLTNLLVFVSLSATVAAVVVCGTLELATGLRPPGIGDPELLALALAMIASGLADAGYMFVLGCSRFRFHAAITISSAWLYAGAIAITDLVTGLTPLSAALVWVGVQGAKAAVLIVASIRAERLGRMDLGLLRESVSFGLRAWIGTLATAFNDRVDQIFVALLASEAVLGVYAVAVNAYEVLLYPAGAAATAILPLAARAAADDRGLRVLSAFRSVAMLTAGRDRGRRARRAAADPARLRLRVRPVADAVPVVAPRRSGVRRAGDLLQRARRVVAAERLLGWASGVARARHRARRDPHPPPRSVRGVGGGEHRAGAGGLVALVLFRRHAAFPVRALSCPSAETSPCCARSASRRAGAEA